MTNPESPVWRSLLFVPANNDKFVASAGKRGADGVVLDLEDAVAPDRKAEARAGLQHAVDQLAGQGSDILVRVNADTLREDIEAACLESVRALVIPKADVAAIDTATALLDEIEVLKDRQADGIGLIAQIEDVQAFADLDSIAGSSPRLLGMSLGSEDFSASSGMQPLPETLYWPNQQVVFACRRAGILPFGFPASITLFSDNEALEKAVAQAADMGFVGALCIHPNQVDVLNRLFTPNENAVTTARSLLSAYDNARKKGVAVFAHEGKMVDLPVILRAREMVNRADAIAAKTLIVKAQVP